MSPPTGSDQASTAGFISPDKHDWAQCVHGDDGINSLYLEFTSEGLPPVPAPSSPHFDHARAPTSHTDAPAPPSPGVSILGIWRLGPLLHRGIGAELTLAQPADAAGSPRWDYVIKRALENTVESRRQISQFVSAASAVAHPNLVAVLDASSTSSVPYLVMPRLEGATMQAYLEASPAKPLPVALWLVRQLAEALDALHNAGWVHGDVKPENAVVGSRGHVTLVDLGFACRTHTAAGHHFRGTPTYAAPESLQDDRAAMPAMDVFSLGRLLWQWLMRADAADQPMIEPIAELVESMIAPDPQERPTAARVAKKLLKLEIETLGRHIGPSLRHRRAA